MTMKVEIWSDYACPFCFIGKRRFQEALEAFEHKDGIEVVYRSFELDPSAVHEPGRSIHELLAAKYGMSVEKARQSNENLGQQAAQLGLKFDFEAMKPGNTFDAHRLMAWAKEQGKGDAMAERLFKAYFTDGLLLEDRKVLEALAEEAGLPRAEASAVLESDRYFEQVRAEEQDGAQLGIQGVPFYVLDRKYGVSGAQHPDAFLQVLRQAWDERQAEAAGPAPESAGDAGAACAPGDEACELPDRH
ncbi:2-hydroxychromene-2-carboxylate isomerase/DsbA-like thioredoxin domain [Paenibacillus pasadenensis]|uniref:2-hydroxychromene-2-carboxylate isomerase/DsbA-like thioredoxin domain n=2 Tax=Paenibacillus pasadenensis TaxID=217090 RepID=A0A2N5N224_9BACL|nr:2-hydroxychromene-2-carboxylate isomerase/DsbA-like thioredoxin domain [Paenibacillus pasadenensis]